MHKQEIIAKLKDNYFSFLVSIHELSEEEYTFQYEDKWTAAQQMEHIVLCVQPLVQVYGMNTMAIEQLFGKTARRNNTYDELVEMYLSKLQAGGKAPTNFLPQSHYSRAQMLHQLNELIQTLQDQIMAFNETELETLLIPHPLLESITLKEMLYNAIYHVEHHQTLMLDNLKQYRL